MRGPETFWPYTHTAVWARAAWRAISAEDVRSANGALTPLRTVTRRAQALPGFVAKLSGLNERSNIVYRVGDDFFRKHYRQNCDH
mmetsp:Transcript_35129/g.91912  ORF Transcript_35129/g.91912 Transcript_35129/m.91912 type:complete len:85 (+) Transcript_35129:1986-2240(+)